MIITFKCASDHGLVELIVPVRMQSYSEFVEVNYRLVKNLKLHVDCNKTLQQRTAYSVRSKDKDIHLDIYRLILSQIQFDLFDNSNNNIYNC